MNTLKIEAKLAEKYKYKSLPTDLSQKYREYFLSNIPEGLYTYGDKSIVLYSNKHTPICNGYTRIVVGDYGAFVEFSQPQCASEFTIQPGQEYRIHDQRYKNNVKYIWLTLPDNSGIKIYLQRKTVSYADYIPSYFYVSVHEVIF